MKTFIVPYNKGSKSAKELAQGLGIKRIKQKNSKFKGTANKTVINWGSSAPTADFGDAVVINRPHNVGLATNKLRTMQVLEDHNVSTPPYTTSKAEAELWLLGGAKVFCRTKLQGHSGEGIVIAETHNELVPAPLYTNWIRIGQEYRVHVFRGEVLDVQRKARKKDVPDDDVNWKIRNLKGGFIFARDDVNPPEDVLKQAIDAVNALGLDFGAVDIITNKFDMDNDVKGYVLEVNTACGLMGTTLEKYINKFGEL
jgi:hypothetical protein